MNIEAFFQVLDLHDMSLTAENKQKLKAMCSTSNNQIKYKDAVALMNVNRDLNEAGSPARNSQGYWMLQLPQRRQKAISQTFKATYGDDVRSNASSRASSLMSDVSIDSNIRLKAEQILVDNFEYGRGIDVGGLDVISETEEDLGPKGKKLNKDFLHQLETRNVRKSSVDQFSGSNSIFSQARHSTISFVNQKSEMKIKKKDIFETERMEIQSQFYENSQLDQDDAYAQFRAEFNTKNHRITGRTQDILMLQRMASSDKKFAFLGKLQPDLSNQKPKIRKQFQHIILEKTQKDMIKHTDRSGSISSDDYLRKAVEYFPHDNYDKKINFKKNIQMEKLKQNNQVQNYLPKNKVNLESLRQIREIGIDDVSRKVIEAMIEEQQDYRSLLAFKNSLFSKDFENQISYDTYKQVLNQNKQTFVNEKIENMFLEAVLHSGKIEKQRIIDILDVIHFFPVKIRRDKNKSTNMFYIMNSNQRGGRMNQEEIIQVTQDEKRNSTLNKVMMLISIKLQEKFNTMSKAFIFIDSNSNQQITKLEFQAAIERMRIKLSKEDIDLVFDHLDKNQDGQINYAEFTELSDEKLRKIDPFESFENQKRLALEREMQDKTFLLKQLHFVGQKLEERFPTSEEAFKFFNYGKNDQITRSQFAQGLQILKLTMGKEEIDLLFNFLDQDKNDYISFEEFKKFEAQNRKKAMVQRDMKDYAKMNEKMSITKAMIMIGNHFDEKFASLKAAFNFFDANGDEQISRKEFINGSKNMKINLSKDDLEMVFQYLDKDKDGNISYSEFSEFEVKRNDKVDNLHLSKVMIFLSSKLEEKFTSMTAAFKFFDTDENKELTRQEFQSGANRMNLNLSKADLDMIFNNLDKDKNGKITYKEFVEFQEGAVIKDRMKISKLLLHISRKLDDEFKDIKEAFQFIDKNSDKVISKEEFRKAIHSLQSNMSSSEIDLVFDFLDQDKDGWVQFSEFCQLDEERKKNGLKVISNGSKADSIKLNMLYIATRLIERFHSMKAAFEFIDEDKDKHIDKKEFSQALEKMNIDLSKNQVAEVFDFLDTDKDGQISRYEFKELENVKPKQQNKQTNMIMQKQGLLNAIEVLNKKFQEQFFNLQSAFNFMDIDKDKQISRKEFKKCCDLMQVPLKDADIEMVFTFLDVNDDGEITYSEFLEFERLQKQRNNVGKIQVIEGLRNANDKKRLDNICVFLASKLKEKFKTVEKSFQHFDTDKHYRLTRKEFLAGLEKLKFSVTKSDIESVFQMVDNDGNGAISLYEFSQFYNFKPKQENQNHQELSQQIKTNHNDKVYQNQLLLSLKDKIRERYGSIEQVFHAFDINGNQEISKIEFAMQMLKFGLCQKTSEADQVFELLDTDNDGIISLEEFVKLEPGYSAYSSVKSTPNQKESETQNESLMKLKAIACCKIMLKFTSLDKAFVFFDADKTKTISLPNFVSGMSKLNMKMAKSDIESLFTLLDSKKSGQLSFSDFCHIKNTRTTPMELSLQTQSMRILTNPYQSVESPGFKTTTFEALENHAESLNLVNHENIQKQRMGMVPSHLKNNAEFAFGLKSGLPDQRNANGSYRKGSSSMGHIIPHTDNLKTGLFKKIKMKLMAQENPYSKVLKSNKTNHTNASLMRSKSVLAKKALQNLDFQLSKVQQSKAFHPQNVSFFEIERERRELNKITMLPPIEQIAQLEPLYADRSRTYGTVGHGFKIPLTKKTMDEKTEISLDRDILTNNNLRTQMSPNNRDSDSQILSKRERSHMLNQYFSRKKTLKSNN